MKYYLFFVFLLSGTLSACCNFLARIFFQNVFSYGISVVLGYFVGMATAYMLYKVVFGNENTQLSSIRRFILVNLIGMAQTYVFSMAFYEIFSLFLRSNHAEDVSHLLALSMLSITSYTLHKNYTFRQKPTKRRTI